MTNDGVRCLLALISLYIVPINICTYFNCVILPFCNNFYDIFHEPIYCNGLWSLFVVSYAASHIYFSFIA